MAAKQLQILSAKLTPAATAFVTLAIAGLLVSGCSSSAVRAKKEQREKAVQASKLYCDFVNGENNPTDIEVALNLSMAQKCDFEKPYSISTYKTPSEVQGLVYCCGIVDKTKKDEKPAAPARVEPPRAEPKRNETPLPELKPGTKTDLKSDFEAPSAPSMGGSAPSTPSTPSNPATKAPADNSYPKVPDLDP